jgi:hypothetical protein
MDTRALDIDVAIGKADRLKQANDLIQIIASCGRHFFSHDGRISKFELDARGRIWFVDAWREARIYTHYTQGVWHGFSEGGTLRDVVIRLRDFIRMGKQCGAAFGPWPGWYSQGDPWGYGSDMQVIAAAAYRLGIAGKPTGKFIIGVDYANSADQTIMTVPA